MVMSLQCSGHEPGIGNMNGINEGKGKSKSIKCYIDRKRQKKETD